MNSGFYAKKFLILVLKRGQLPVYEFCVGITSVTQLYSLRIALPLRVEEECTVFSFPSLLVTAAVTTLTSYGQD